jgi:hypothetical protein
MIKLSRLIELLQAYLDKHGDGDLPMGELIEYLRTLKED